MSGWSRARGRDHADWTPVGWMRGHQGHWSPSEESPMEKTAVEQGCSEHGGAESRAPA